MWLVLLQPISPLRAPKDIDICLQLVSSCPDAPFALSVKVLQKPPTLDFLAQSRRQSGFPLFKRRRPPQCRQDVRPACLLSYVKTVPNFLAAGFRLDGALAHMMPDDRSMDIDNNKDLARAEEILRRRGPEVT
jgi:CMP-N-acetylneuraminic acid synthetase